MNINEIYLMPEKEPDTYWYTDSLKTWSSLKTKYPVHSIGTLDNFPMFMIKGQLGQVHICVYDSVSKKCVLFMDLTKSKSFYQVAGLAIAPSYAGHGIPLKLYKFLLNKGFSIMSDESQTIGGKKIWDKLRNDPDFEVKAYDPRNQLSMPIDNTIYSDDDLVLIAKKK
jgi:hypothetical protein